MSTAQSRAFAAQPERTRGSATIWIGRVLSALVVLFLLFAQS